MNFLFSIFGSRFWERMRDILNPDTSLGADPWVYYFVYAFCVFAFNIIDIVSEFPTVSSMKNFYIVLSTRFLYFNRTISRPGQRAEGDF